MTATNAPLRVFEDDLFVLDHVDTCAVPGYLVLRLKAPAHSLADLTWQAAQRLGVMLGRAVRAIEAATGADRVYCLSFCELDRRLHFHLFPRSRWVLERYWEATGTTQEPINGPAVFEWARGHLVASSDVPEGAPGVADVCGTLRMQLA